MGDEEYKDHRRYNHLYVIFHGSWAFDDSDSNTCVRAYATDIPEHTFIAGSWLGETKIVRGSCLELIIGNWTCAKDETGWRMRDHLSGKFVLFCKKTPTPDKRYAEITLPRPTCIIPQIPAGDVGLKQPICESSAMFLVPVFHYAYDRSISHKSVRLESTPRTKEDFWTADPPDLEHVTTLHCFAADDRDDRKNGAGDFSKTAALLGYSISLPACSIVEATNRTVDIPRLDHRAYEVTTFLNERVDWLRDLARHGLNPISHPRKDPPSDPSEDRSVAGTVCEKNMDYTSCGGGGGGS